MSNNVVFHRSAREALPAEGRRPVILHFHTFKNAGSSVDAVLRKCFPNAWENYDGPVPEFFIHHSEITIIARNRLQLEAISSHQVRLPNPDFPGVEFLPIVFIRRPELRIASIWRFQRQRNDDHPGTLLAKKLGFRDWVAHCIDLKPPYSITNLQTHLFGYRMDQRTPRNDSHLFEYAMNNVEALPFMGIVEHFDESMRIYESLYSPKVRDFKYEPVTPRNVTGRIDGSLGEKLDTLREDLGSELFERIQNANADDIALYEFAYSRYLERVQPDG